MENKRKEHASPISKSVKKLATLALIAAGSLTAGSQTQASVQGPGTITDRVAKVRQAVLEKTTRQNLSVIEKQAIPETLLAQWGNYWASALF
jgi:hypothetical protein